MTNENTQKLKIQIPFEGFYNSTYDAIFDSELENELDNFASEYSASKTSLLAWSDAFMDAVNWRAAQRECAKEYVNEFERLIEEETGILLGLEFDEMTSPREYNFQTDKIFGLIEPEKVQAIFDKVTKENLQALISERHTSRSGFISFYKNTLAEWPENPLEWDEIQLDTLLQAFLFQEMGEDWQEKFNAYSLMEDCRCNGELQNWLWNSMEKADCDYINALDSAIREEDEKGFFELVARHAEKKAIKLKGEVMKTA